MLKIWYDQKGPNKGVYLRWFFPIWTFLVIFMTLTCQTSAGIPWNLSQSVDDTASQTKRGQLKASLLGKLYKLIPSVCYWKNVKWTSACWVLVKHAYSVILLRIPGRSSQPLRIVYVELLCKNYREFLSEFHRIPYGAWKHCPVFRQL